MHAWIVRCIELLDIIKSNALHCSVEPLPQQSTVAKGTDKSERNITKVGIIVSEYCLELMIEHLQILTTGSNTNLICLLLTDLRLNNDTHTRLKY